MFFLVNEIMGSWLSDEDSGVLDHIPKFNSLIYTKFKSCEACARFDQQCTLYLANLLMLEFIQSSPKK